MRRTVVPDSQITTPSSADKKQDEDDSQQTDSENILEQNEIIEDRFVVVEKLQSGAFGQVFLAFDRRNNDLEVALKIEKPRPDGKKSFCAHEVTVLQRCQGQRHIPELFAFNTGPPKPYIAMQVMSYTLAELRRACPSKTLARFSLSTSIRVGIQALTGIRELHEVGVIHRDIKPSNFMLGSTDRTKRCVYLLDFGLSRIFQKPTGEMIPPRIQPGFVGSTRYASPNAHDGRELGRCDDLMSLLYVFVEMRLGRLPWRNIGVRSVVGIMKRASKIEQLCNGLPAAIAEWARMIERLKYPDEPNYEKMDASLRLAAEENRVVLEAPYDWEEAFVRVLREDDEQSLQQPVSSPSSGRSSSELP